MGLVGVAGLLIALSAAYFAQIRGSRLRFVVFVLLFVLHTAASAVYYFYVQTSGGDAQFYYNDPLGFYGRVGGLGTDVIINIVQGLKENLGGSMFDYFLLFQAAGFWGLVVLAKIFQEILEEVGVQPSGWTYLPLFLPGPHYWTAAIGKDGIVFLAIALSIWATMRLGKRLQALGLAILMLVAVRPHMGVLALASLAFAALFDRRTKLWVKGLLVVGIVVGGAAVFNNIKSTYYFDPTDANSVSDYIESRAAIGDSFGADRSITDQTFAVRILFLWSRPFFIDAENTLAYIASLENIALMFMIGLILFRPGPIRALSKKILYIRYSIAMFASTTLLVAAVNYNVGLGLRQKMMAVVPLMVIFITLIALRSAARARAAELPNMGAQAGLTAPAEAYLKT
ncbi:MAG: hypothetical protein M3N39_08195 [Pseudomonadota bacterium]|nr:hypothetical protein [Pseudomonadota bacterium]